MKIEARTMNVIITRSREGNEELAAKLAAAGMVAISAEAISLAPSDDPAIEDILRNLPAFDWLIFTSAAGAAFFLKRMERLSLSLPSSLQVAAVGRRTAESLARGGVAVAFTPPEFSGESLGRTLPGRGRALILHADIANKNLAEMLVARGFTVQEVPLYRTEPVGHKISDDQLLAADAIIFASPSAVRAFCRGVGGPALIRLKALPAACIGPSTGKAASEEGFKKIIIPEEHTLDRLIEEIRRVAS